MKSSKFVCVIALAAIGLVSCAKENSNGGHSETVTRHFAPVGYESYEAYYNKFLFEPQECNPDKSRYYRFAGSDGFSKIKEDKEHYFDVDLHLLKDGTYIVEIDFLLPAPQWGFNTMIVEKTEVQRGRWSVVEEKIVLENLGYGKALTYNDSPAIDLYLTNVQVNPIYNGSSTIIVGMLSTSTLEELRKKCN